MYFSSKKIQNKQKHKTKWEPIITTMNVHFFFLSKNEHADPIQWIMYLFRLITTQNGLNRIQVEISGSSETALYHREMSASRFKYSMIFSLLLHLNAYASKKETWTGYFFVFVTHSFIYEVFFLFEEYKKYYDFRMRDLNWHRTQHTLTQRILYDWRQMNE